jgi:hypothetical protein
MGSGQGNTQMGGGGGMNPMTPQQLEKALQKRVAGQGLNAEDLTGVDKKAILDYMGKGGKKMYDISAEDFNRALYDPAWLSKQSAKFQSDVAAQAKLLDEALSKLKDYKGDVYRLIDDPVGVKILPSGDVAVGPGLHNMGSRAATFEPGKVITMNSPTSASRVKNAVNFNYNAPLTTGTGMTRIKIRSKTGKSIEKIAPDILKAEREVLFRQGTKFRVESRTFNRRMNTWDVVLTEV